MSASPSLCAVHTQRAPVGKSSQKSVDFNYDAVLVFTDDKKKGAGPKAGASKVRILF